MKRMISVVAVAAFALSTAVADDAAMQTVGWAGGYDDDAARGDVVYSNRQDMWGACFGQISSEFGDDLQGLTGSGLWDHVCFGICPCDPNGIATLVSADVHVRLYDLTMPGYQVGDLIGEVVFEDYALSLSPGVCATPCEYGLSGLGVVIPDTDIVATLECENAVWSPPCASCITSQVMADPPTVGFSDDRYWQNYGPGHPSTAWYWFGGYPVANWAWEIGVVPDPCAGQGLGDANGDGSINGLDVDPFVDALTDPDQYNTDYEPLMWQCTADANGDGSMNGLDIDPFVALLVGS